MRKQGNASHIKQKDTRAKVSHLTVTQGQRSSLWTSGPKIRGQPRSPEDTEHRSKKLEAHRGRMQLLTCIKGEYSLSISIPNTRYTLYRF